jgi:CheY-like chemotaxis protein
MAGKGRFGWTSGQRGTASGCSRGDHAVTLPKRTSYALDAATLDIPTEERPAAKIEVPQEYASTRKQRVLLLDDRDDFRDVLREYLESRLYEVTAVSNGVEGLREIMKDTFDLIVCDMMMPQLGGEMFYWAVTRVRPAARLRFIFFTGHKNDPKIQAFFQRVNATVLIKPFMLDALNAAILDVLKKLR